MHEAFIMTKPASLEPDRYALIANLEYVQIAGIRTHSNALVLCRDHRPLAARPEYRYRLRGFSSSSQEPTFDCEVPSDEFELADARDPSIVISSKDRDIPLIHGAVMRIVRLDTGGSPHRESRIARPDRRAQVPRGNLDRDGVERARSERPEILGCALLPNADDGSDGSRPGLVLMVKPQL